jgi:hypothetical protein
MSPTCNRGLKKINWEFEIYNCDTNLIQQIKNICESISKEYKIELTKNNIKISLKLNKSNYKSFIINNFKDITQHMSIKETILQNQILNIDNIEEIISDYLTNLNNSIKLLDINNIDISNFISLYKINYNKIKEELEKIDKYLTKDILLFYNMDGKLLQIKNNINLYLRKHKYYIEYKKNLLYPLYYNYIQKNNYIHFSNYTENINENKILNLLKEINEDDEQIQYNNYINNVIKEEFNIQSTEDKSIEDKSTEDNSIDDFINEINILKLEIAKLYDNITYEKKKLNNKDVNKDNILKLIDNYRIEIDKLDDKLNLTNQLYVRKLTEMAKKNNTYSETLNTFS